MYEKVQQPVEPQSNLKQLFEEFKFHLIYRNKQNKCSKNVNSEFKELLGQLRESNRVKKARVRGVQQEVDKQMKKQSRITFSRPGSSLFSKIWKPKEINGDSLEEIKENIIVVEQERDSLNTEIAHLQASLAKLKKNVGDIKKDVEVENTKIKKYKHISYLAGSIQRNTEGLKIVNSRAFQQMIIQQEEALGSLKHFRGNLRKENDELENKLAQTQVTKKSKRPTVQQKCKELEVGGTKIDKRFMNNLQELIQLFMQRELEFDQIKIEQTTKIRLKKVQKQYLKQDRVKMHELIQKFEEKHDVKIESLANLVIFIHQRLKNDCQDLENECIKRNEIKQLLIEELDNLKCVQTEGKESQKELRINERDACNKREKIFRNSKMLMQVVNLFHNLIGKFKYLFTMAITLSKEKKNFHDLLLQIGHRFNPNNVLEEREDDLAGMNKITNYTEMEEILQMQQTNLTTTTVGQALSLIYSDLRYALIFRKNWLDQEGTNNDPISILDKVQNIQNKCDEIYDSKIKIYCLLLINCLKALMMNKYEKKMVASSKANDSLFIGGPKTIKIVNLEDVDEADTPTQKELKVTQTKFNTDESESHQERCQLGTDPRRMVQMLERVKNEEKRSFKPMKFSGEQVYLYDRKVVLPKYVYE